MAVNRLSSVLHQLLRSVAPAERGQVGDAELLDRFIQRRDEAAFELLVWRHGPMVLNLCQRLLHDAHDAEDAFQATFLVLVRKARSISKRDSLASWLYKVAYRIACRARPRVPVVSNVETILAGMPALASADEVIWRELRGRLDQEVARLPESYRRAIVLCCFEGKTQDEAARLLGWPKGTVATRLARARERLRGSLQQSGLAVSSFTLAGLLGQQAAAGAIPAELVRSTLAGALAYASGPTAAGAILSAKTLALTEGVLRIMWYSKLKLLTGMFLAIALAGGGIGLAVRQAWAGDGPNEDAAPQVDGVPVAAQVKSLKGAASSADVANLRREVETLRRELETALREIDNLKAGLRLPAAPPEKGPLYRGRPASFWLDQLKDADADYRTDGVKALGELALQQKSLIPTLVGALGDRSHQVGAAASSALSRIGPEVLPLVLEVLKDKKSAASHSQALVVVAAFGPEAKAAVPSLIVILKDQDSKNWSEAIEALHRIGLDARPALPALVETLGRTLKIYQEKKYEITTWNHGFPGRILQALAEIDPECKLVLPKELAPIIESRRPFGQGSGFGGGRDRDTNLSGPFQQAYEQLRKKYALQEK